MFLVVDGWLTLRQDYEELEPAVTALAARGLGYGIHVIAVGRQVVGVPPGGAGPVRHPA